MKNNLLIVLITTPSIVVGKQIATALVENRLAACVNLLPSVSSIFHWEGAISHEEEVLLIAKTRADLFDDQFIPAVLSLHPYQVPEIIALPVIKGNQKYLDWIEAETSPVEG
jgi:periplasmic divalent cation tolerance protein